MALHRPPVAAPGITAPSVCSASISPCFSTYIPLMRLVQTVHHSKRRGGAILREGWLLHHTNADLLVSRRAAPSPGCRICWFFFYCLTSPRLVCQKKRHYWILDWKSITLFQSESSTKYYKVSSCERVGGGLEGFWCNSAVLLQEIPLSQVLHVRGPAQLAAPPLLGDGARHSFEVATASLVYRVTASGAEGQAWADAIRQALMPIEGSGSGEEVRGERAVKKKKVPSGPGQRCDGLCCGYRWRRPQRQQGKLLL